MMTIKTHCFSAQGQIWKIYRSGQANGVGSWGCPGWPSPYPLLLPPPFFLLAGGLLPVLGPYDTLQSGHNQGPSHPF